MGSFSGNFYSEELKTTTRINLILPDASNDVTPLLGGTPKLLFLLHGLGGNCDEWLRFSKIEYYAKKFNLIVVMPEAQRSFYCDYPTAPRYFHYVADELPQLCEQWFALRRPREDCMIAGESMGGYGALKIGLRRPERFGTIAALSGVLDFRRFVDEARAGMLPALFRACWTSAVLSTRRAQGCCRRSSRASLTRSTRRASCPRRTIRSRWCGAPPHRLTGRG